MTYTIPDAEEEPFLPDDGNVKMRKGGVLQKSKKISIAPDVIGTPKRTRGIYRYTHSSLKMNSMKYLWILIFVLIMVTGSYYHSLRRMKIIQKLAIIQNDYSEISGLQDLITAREVLNNICFPKMKSKCSCPDPLTPSGRLGRRHWLKTMHEHKDDIHDLNGDVDVVFYGDSITEGWKGTSYGFPNGRKDKNLEVYEKHFTTKGGAKYIGIPLGISGDRTTDLLWRLQNGELPPNLNPKVFWLLIGTNDLGVSWCSPEATLIGILRVVEEIRQQRPGTLVVVNGLLPRSFDMENGFLYHSSNILMWNAIREVNAKLKAYCDHKKGVVYVDSTDLFLVDPTVPEKMLQIDRNLMNDFLHPSYIGYKIWGDSIIEKLNELI